MKLTINKKEANAMWGALQFYVFETTHTAKDNSAVTGLPEGKEKELLKSVMDKLLKLSKMPKESPILKNMLGQQGCGQLFERDNFRFQCGLDYSHIPKRNFKIELCPECSPKAESQSAEGKDE